MIHLFSEKINYINIFYSGNKWRIIDEDNIIRTDELL